MSKLRINDTELCLMLPARPPLITVEEAEFGTLVVITAAGIEACIKFFADAMAEIFTTGMERRCTGLHHAAETRAKNTRQLQQFIVGWLQWRRDRQQDAGMSSREKSHGVPATTAKSACNVKPQVTNSHEVTP